jgi:hypothetical protein
MDFPVDEKRYRAIQEIKAKIAEDYSEQGNNFDAYLVGIHDGIEIVIAAIENREPELLFLGESTGDDGHQYH